jgi:hypothetical protein
MTVPKALRFLSRTNGNRQEQIYCRRHNKLYSRCPLEGDPRALHSCECLAQCEMALKGNGIWITSGRYPKSA